MSLGNVLATAAPIAAGYFGGPALAGSFGMSAAGGAIAAGALTGAGIAALSGGDILTSVAMGGLGGYAGGEMFTAFNPAAGVDASVKAGTTTAVANEAMLSPYTNLAPTVDAAGSGAGNLGMFSNPQAVSPYSSGAMTNAIGANTPVGLNSANPIARTQSIVPQGANINTGTQLAKDAYTTGNASKVAGIPDAGSGGYAGNPAPPDTSFSAGVKRLGGGDSVMGYGKLGLAGLPVLAAAYEPETFTYDQMREAEAYDPDATLNLDDPALDSGIEDVINEDSGLRLYAKEGGMIPTYAEGGAIESRANQGMRDALARNQGTAYTQPTTTAPSNNIRIAGADNSTSNIGRGMGSLNVGSGSIGQSPNAIAEAARLKAIEDAKPKTRTMQGAYGMQMTVPIDYDPGTKSLLGSRAPSHYQLQDGTWVKGTPPSNNTFYSNRTNAYGYLNRFAEGGAIESRANQGMRDALARNQGTAYTQPTTAYTPTTAPSNNIKIAGADNSTSNLTGGVGSLNVNSGAIGQSANAVAEAARLKAIEDAKPKYITPTSGVNVGGGGGPGSFSVPSELVMGQGYMPTGAIMQGPAANYYRDIAGNFIRRAQGGIIPAAYAKGGMLEGPGDGMSDSLAAQIDGSQPAALSQGEFVVPADVVSHLGNGSSDAGSKRLYAMMDEVRKARTGTEKQGKEINPERYMPA